MVSVNESVHVNDHVSVNESVNKSVKVFSLFRCKNVPKLLL